MRWNRLFDDLEGQADGGRAAEDADVASEEERLRIAKLALRDRLVAAPPPVRLELRDGSHRELLSIGSSGADWVSGTVRRGDRGHATVIVPLAAIAAVRCAIAQAEASLAAPPTAAGIPLAMALRTLARRRTPVDLATDSGSWHGTIDRVGADHLDLAEHERGVPRRAGAVTGVRIVPLARIVSVGY